MDESFIYERLKALSGGVERAQYRDISKAFMEVVRYNREALEDLKRQIDQELRDVSQRFYLYGAVTSKNDAQIVNDFLFPICDETAEGSLATIFCRCPQKEMEEIFSQDQELLIETGDGTVEAMARIRPCQRYRQKIEHLKSVFYENGIYWRTPYLPYVDKFGDVFCDGLDGDCEIRSIRFKNRDCFVACDLIPLWNVEPIKLKCTVFPIPAVDEQNYRHTLRLPFSQDGYAVLEGSRIKNVYMSSEGLEIITGEKLQKEFDLYRIAVKRDVSVPHYSLTTNFRPMRHIDRQADHSPGRLLTMAEIHRIVGSYEAGRGLELKEITLGARGDITSLQDRYQYVPPGREEICLEFYTASADFITEDLIAFLVGEVQSYFPQLLVTGRLSDNGDFGQ